MGILKNQRKSLILDYLFMLETFFDLSQFPHALLFEKAGPCPWNALEILEAYLKANSFGKIEGEISSNAYLINPETITIGEGSVVEAGAYIQGPCIIGKGCTIRHGAYLRGNVLTGDGCVIGHTTEVKNSIFLNKAHAAHFAYLGDSIVGNGVNLGAGVKCANLRLDKQPIEVLFHEELLKTGMKKLGALIGDNAQIGCGVVINPGTLIQKLVISHPNLVLSGFIPEKSIVKPAYKPVILKQP